ncbi:hypothetical protein [Salinicoccus roseus]|uniref:hypothetical protein n=1 Tax=Salinicoccus roseus TaxID=45670 RepID=UPI0022FFDC44|nr:hypothetical protein [Salinicoccus roseus]
MDQIKVKVVQQDSKKFFERQIESFMNTTNIEVVDIKFSPILHGEKRTRYLAIVLYKVKTP